MSDGDEYGGGYESSDGFSAHVDAVRILKRDLEMLRRDLGTALFTAEIVRTAARAAVGEAGNSDEPESARLIRLWTEENVNEINALIRGIDNTNEEADSYLRYFGG